MQIYLLLGEFDNWFTTCCGHGLDLIGVLATSAAACLGKEHIGQLIPDTGKPRLLKFNPDEPWDTRGSQSGPSLSRDVRFAVQIPVAVHKLTEAS